MNCHYCQEPCLHPNPDRRSWYCEPCNTAYEGSHITIWCHLNKHRYAVQYRFEHCQYPTVIFKLYKVGDIYTHIVGEEDLRFEKILDITPQNIQEKLKTYLLFS